MTSAAAPCPACQHALEPLTVAPPQALPVTLDLCPRCGGVWFDRGELQRSSKVQLERGAREDEVEYQCPRGHGHLWAQRLGEDHWASACAQCFGQFIDGETVDFALKLHPAIATPKPPRKLKRDRELEAEARAPVDYLKDIVQLNVCVECRDETLSSHYSWAREGFVCFECKSKLGLRTEQRGQSSGVTIDLVALLFKKP